MPALNTSKLKVPELRLHKPTGQGYVRIDGAFRYLGRYDDPQTQQRYHRMIAEWMAAGCQVFAEPDEITIKELITRYLAHVEQYYRKPDGTPTSEIDSIKSVLRVLGDLYSETRVQEFGPRALIAVRQRMIDQSWCRKSINKHVCRMRAMFRWATEHEMIPGGVYHALTAVAGLKRGRSGAREGDAVRPVSLQEVNAIQPFVSRQVWAMVQLQLLTGARAGEIVTLRKCDIDRSGEVWVYVPADHKTAHHGHERTIFFGPKAQEVLAPFLMRPDEMPLFSPAEAERERRAARFAARKTPLGYGNCAGSNRRKAPMVTPGKSYDVDALRRAIARGCDHANPPPEPLAQREDETEIEWKSRLTPEQKKKLRAWRKAHRWHPHQLRHTAATALRKQFGLEAARVVLGHTSAAVTEIYAEIDKTKAREAMLKIG